jgi:hypothetical protein
VNRSSAIATVGSSRRQARRGGYVLLMTLALLVIAALAQAGLARRSLHAALAANEAQSELQRHWAAASCRDFMLQQAETIFIQMEEAGEQRRPRWPTPRHINASLKLGEFDIQLVLADEDAKTNLNALQAKKPTDVHLALIQHARSGLTPELRLDMSREGKLRKRWFATWGQVFPIASTLALPDGWERLVQVSQEITCWGDGKPNIRRASDQTVETIATTAIGGAAARKLLEARRAVDDDLLLADLLGTLDLRRADQLKLRGVLSDRSSCYSLSMALGEGRRRWYHLWVQGDRAASGGANVQSFSW